jgi:hypothetical protein
MDERLGRIEEKIDRLDERLDSVDKTMIRQNTELTEHIRRTENLENRVDPLEKYVWMALGAIALIGFLGTVFAVVKFIF